MRRMVALLFLLLLLLTTCLTGCAGAPQSRESGATAVVSVLGVEPAGEGIRLLAAAEGRGGGLPGRQPGDTPPPRWRLSPTRGRVVSCAHGALLSLQTAAATLPALLSYAFQEPQQSTETQMWVVQADTLAESFSGEGDTAQRMTVIQSQGKDRQTFAPLTLRQAAAALDKGEPLLIPALSVGEAGLAFAGFALYQDGAITRWLTGPAALGAALLSGEKIHWTGSLGEEALTLQSTGCQVHPVWEGGRVVGLDLRCRLEGVLTGGWTGEATDPAPLERETAQAVLQALDQLQAAGADAAGLLGRAGLSNPFRWDALNGQWQGVFPTLPATCTVTVYVTRAGEAQTTPSAAAGRGGERMKTGIHCLEPTVCGPAGPALGTELPQAAWPRWGRRPGCAPSRLGWGWWPWGCLNRRCPPGRRDWGQRVTRRWGRRTARVLAGVFLLWGLFLAAAHAERIGSRLSDSLRAAPVLLTAAVLLLAGWMAAGGLPAFARACEVFLLAVGAGFVVILLFGIFRLDWSLTLLWTREELAQVPAGALSTAGTMAVGGYALFLLGDVRPEAGGADGMLRRLALLFALLAGAVLLVLGQLGSALAAQVDRPFLQMVSGLGFEGAFQRLEELVSALWVLGDVALLGLLLLCLGRLLAWLLDRPVGKGKAWLLTGAVFLLGLPAALWDHPLAGTWVPFGNPRWWASQRWTPAGNGEEKKLEKSEKRG